METIEIFEKNQILTLEVARALMGKKIAITSPEYKANQPTVREFRIGEIISAWDHAAKIKYPDSSFNNMQEYWLSYMTTEQADNQIDKLLLLDDKGEQQAVAYLNSFYPEPTFTGSDEDREVYYIEID